MKAIEADKVIAEYMKQDVSWKTGSTIGFGFDCSLDSLVPVWKKLEAIEVVLDIDTDYWCQVTHSLRGSDGILSKNSEHCDLSSIETIQEAAAIATAKCILELGKEGGE